jgi:hypothetical protein
MTDANATHADLARQLTTTARSLAWCASLVRSGPQLPDALNPNALGLLLSAAVVAERTMLYAAGILLPTPPPP